MGTVYLLHFDKPYRHAKHYLGYTEDLTERLARHRNGNGARLLQVISEVGISWRLARTWAGGRDLERKLKRQKNGPRFCPICKREGVRKVLDLSDPQTREMLQAWSALNADQRSALLRFTQAIVEPDDLGTRVLDMRDMQESQTANDTPK